MQVLQVSPANEADAADAFGDAFRDDPFVSWMYPDPARRRAHFSAMMARLLRVTRPVNRVLSTPHSGACALWIPPGADALPLRQQLQMAPVLRGFGRRAPRVLAALDLLNREHPREPHWYLFVVGSREEVRGQGHGRAVIEPVLADCDRDRLPAYLESSNPDNVPYYERFGFRSVGELTRAGSPPMIPMWRDPR